MLVAALRVSVLLAYFKYSDEISTYYFPSEAHNHNIYSMFSFLMMMTRLAWITMLIGVPILSFSPYVMFVEGRESRGEEAWSCSLHDKSLPSNVI